MHAEPDWEQRTRESIVSLMADARAYESAGDAAKAVATYEVLLELVGTHDIGDPALLGMVDRAKRSHAELNRAIQDAKATANAIIDISVSVALRGGEHISPRTQLILAERGGALGTALTKLRSSVTRLGQLDAEYGLIREKARNARLLPSSQVEAVFARQRELITAVADARRQVVADEATVGVAQAGAVTGTTDAAGRCRLTTVEPGRYTLFGKASLSSQEAYWFVEVNKGDAPADVTLNNDNLVAVDAVGR